jgi:NADH-quinone oxidoreductase subunit G
VIDLCPVGALLSRSFFYRSRVWYLQATSSVCPGCARGCAVDLWHRKPEWKLLALDPRRNVTIERVTPRENPAVNGRWICNKGRDLARIFERPRALQAMRKGQPVDLTDAIAAARRLVDAARHPVALVSSWGSNEELAAFRSLLGERFTAYVKDDHVPAPGEPLQDDFLIRADKNPNGTAARALYASLPKDPTAALEGADLMLVWGEGFALDRLPPTARCVLLDAYAQPEHAAADVFIPLSIQTERRGHYTNFAGVVSAFEPCFPKPPTAMDAEALFATLAARAEAPA